MVSDDSNLATAALERLVGVLGEDAIFVLAAGARDPKDALDEVLQRRGVAYTAAVQGQPHTRMTSQFEAWEVDMTHAMAPVWPPSCFFMRWQLRRKSASITN